MSRFWARDAGIFKNVWADSLCGWTAFWGQVSPLGAEPPTPPCREFFSNGVFGSPVRFRSLRVCVVLSGPLNWLNVLSCPKASVSSAAACSNKPLCAQWCAGLGVWGKPWNRWNGCKYNAWSKPRGESESNAYFPPRSDRMTACKTTKRTTILFIRS